MDRRNTIQGTLILDAVGKLHCHATADEVYDEVAKSHPGISRVTVYRNLKRLSDMQKIRKIEVPCGADRYDDDCTPHYHVVCEKCGKVFDVDMDYLPDMQRYIRDAHGFDYTGCDIIFKGVCPSCKRADGKNQ